MLKRLLVIVGGLFGAAVIGGLLIPDPAHVQRSVVIHAPAERIFPLISDLHQTVKWSPWLVRDPDIQLRFEEPGGSNGAKMYWSSAKPEVGSGSQEIVDSRPNEFVSIRLEFGNEGPAHAYFQLHPGEGGTEVVWGFEKEFGLDLPGRYLGLLFDRLIGPDFEQGLSNLKHLAETPPG